MIDRSQTAGLNRSTVKAVKHGVASVAEASALFKSSTSELENVRKPMNYDTDQNRGGGGSWQFRSDFLGFDLLEWI